MEYLKPREFVVELNKQGSCWRCIFLIL